MSSGACDEGDRNDVVKHDKTMLRHEQAVRNERLLNEDTAQVGGTEKIRQKTRGDRKNPARQKHDREANKMKAQATLTNQQH